jgi:hypothetical protein
MYVDAFTSLFAVFEHTPLYGNKHAPASLPEVPLRASRVQQSPETAAATCWEEQTHQPPPLLLLLDCCQHQQLQSVGWNLLLLLLVVMALAWLQGRLPTCRR